MTIKETHKKLLKWMVFLLVGFVFYFANHALQIHFGKQALTKIQFKILDLDAALTKAEALDKLVLADMSAIWCSTCRKLDSTIFADARVKATIERDFVFARVEYESQQGEAFMKKYQVSGFPTLLVLNSDGEKLTRLPLTFDSHEFIGHLNAVLASNSARH
jgi:thiol:disulfide interchange protein